MRDRHTNKNIRPIKKPAIKAGLKTKWAQALS
jgi:hypothetical protein